MNDASRNWQIMWLKAHYPHRPDRWTRVEWQLAEAAYLTEGTPAK